MLYRRSCPVLHVVEDAGKRVRPRGIALAETRVHGQRSCWGRLARMSLSCLGCVDEQLACSHHVQQPMSWEGHTRASRCRDPSGSPPSLVSLMCTRAEVRSGSAVQGAAGSKQGASGRRRETVNCPTPAKLGAACAALPPKLNSLDRPRRCVFCSQATKPSPPPPIKIAGEGAQP